MSPSAIPAPAASSPTTTLKMALLNASRYSPSSKSRTVSKLHVENVVYAPQNPVPTRALTTRGI